MDDSERERSRFDQIRDFCADTTAHGLARVATAKSWLARLFWMVVIIFASTLSVYQITLSVTAYLQYRTKTHVLIVSKEKLSFPAVTVCNINPFKLSEIENTPIWNSVKSVISRKVQSGQHIGFDVDKEKLKNTILVNVTRSFNENSWKMGHLGEELISFCQFPGNHRDRYCSYRNFSHFFDMLYGNCYTYNGSKASVTQPGHRQGFKIQFFIDTDEYTGLLADSVGALVTIHSPYIEPVLDENSIFVAPGSSVFVSLHLENITLMGHPYNGGNCTNNISYSQTSCLRNCVAKQMKRECGCVSASMRHQPVCDPFNQKQADCLHRVNLKGDFRNCYCDPPCKRLHFLHTVSNSAWPFKTHLPKLLKFLKTKSRIGKRVTNLNSARENMAMVDIHFASMQLKIIEQGPAMTDVSLMGDIGGQLGLFIGVSCITLVEFFDLLWRLIVPRKKKMPNQVAALEVPER